MQQPTIRIRKAHDGPWIAVPLLTTRLGWCCVDDGGGPLWVQWSAIHPDDRDGLWAALLLAANRAQEGRG